MKVRIKRVGIQNMFRLSKLGRDCSNDEFMDKHGNIFGLISEPNKPRVVVQTAAVSPLLFERAKRHPDWSSDTR